MPPVHLLVILHGLWGNPGNVSELDRIIKETYPEPAEDGTVIRTFFPVTNRSAATYDGIDWCGERVATEIYFETSRVKFEGSKVVKFSIAGYSLGGLVARFAVGKLKRDGFFTKIQPVNFATIATPHFGLPRFNTIVSGVIVAVTSVLIGRTGKQFCFKDDWLGDGRPLIEVLADPRMDFYQALAAFQNIGVYANALNDLSVPYVTAAIESFDPFVNGIVEGLTVEMDEEYMPLIKSYKLPCDTLAKPRMFSYRWLEAHKPLPILPPFLQLKFPYNLALYSSLPFALPLSIPVVLAKFAIHSIQSRRRLKKLKGNPSPWAVFPPMVEKLLETDGLGTWGTEYIDCDAPAPEINEAKVGPGQPLLLPAQRRVISWLNALPIKKRIVYVPRVRNSHGIIVCRDADQYEAHRAGEGVLRHWASAFLT